MSSKELTPTQTQPQETAQALAEQGRISFDGLPGLELEHFDPAKSPSSFPDETPTVNLDEIRDDSDDLPTADPTEQNEDDPNVPPEEVGHLGKDLRPNKVARRATALGLMALTLTGTGIVQGMTAERADAKYHFINKGGDQYPTWDALNTPDQGFIVSNEPPEGVPAERWVARLSGDWLSPDGTGQKRTGAELAQNTIALLSSESPPARVILDEVRVNSLSRASDYATEMLKHPEFNGKWGAALVDGPGVSYAKLKSFLIPALKSDAIILPEFYPNAKDYFKERPLLDKVRIPGTNRTKIVKIPFSKLSSQQVQLARNRWMGDYISGSGGYGYNKIPKLNFLMEQRQKLGSHSEVVPLIAVTDKFTGGASRQADFIAEEFYVLKNFTRFGNYLLKQNPAGSWKHSPKHGSNTSVDTALANFNRGYHGRGVKARMRPIPKPFNVTPKTLPELRKRQAAGFTLKEK